MTLDDYKNINIPDGPGVYFFRAEAGSSILYIGKATSLKERVRSYFNDDLIKTRGRLLVDMVTQAETVTYQETDSVLEAFILESELIKKYQPRYNTKEKDNKSFNYIVITKEDYPRVLVVRGRDLEKGGKSKKERIEQLGYDYSDLFGPYPFGSELKEALKLVRKIFPYRDTCEVCTKKGKGKISSNGSTVQNTSEYCKPCFNRTIGLCPGVCTGEIGKDEYAFQIKHIKQFFAGKKKEVVEELKKRMFEYAGKQEFEKAHELKKTIDALLHIQDISMIKKEAQYGTITRDAGTYTSRVEAYDIAHMSGTDMVGVMVVMQDGEFAKHEYKKFNIKHIRSSNDTGALTQVLERRFSHTEWSIPTHIVLDGGIQQMNAAEKVLNSILQKTTETKDTVSGVHEALRRICLFAVTKDETHKAKYILRSPQFKGVGASDSGGRVGDKTDTSLDTLVDDGDIISINQECHRFAIQTHRKRRSLSRGL